MPQPKINDGLQTVAQFPAKAECRTDLVLASEIEVAQRAFEQFLAGLADVLPGYLLTPVEINSAGIEQQVLFDAFQTRESGSCTVLFALQPHEPRIRLELGGKFAGAALESMLGASSETAGLPRESLTDVDVHILRDLIDLVAEELRKAWSLTPGYSLDVVSTELTSEFDDSQSRDQGVVLLTGEITMRECKGSIRLLVPALLLRLISTDGIDAACSVSDQRAALVQALADASLDVEAVLEGARIQFRDLLGLQPGKILQLPHKTDADVECHVNGVVKFRGELVSSGESLGLQIQS